MATNPEQITDPNAPDPNAEDPNAVDPNAAANDPADDTPEPIVELARDMGWTPREEYTGPPESFKDARTFIRDGRDIQREASREVKALRSQLDTIAKTTGSIVEQQVKERVDQLSAQFSKAVEDGDTQAAFKISRQIDEAQTAGKTPAGAAPPPEAQSFAERNSSWFTKTGKEYETARAIELSKLFASQGYTDPGVQLRLVEQRMRVEFPDLFRDAANGRKPAPGVNAPGSRTAGPTNRQKGWADMPLESQKALEGIIERNPTITKEQIAKNYWANEAAKK